MDDELSGDDVLLILELVERSEFDFVSIKAGGLTLTVSNGEARLEDQDREELADAEPSSRPKELPGPVPHPTGIFTAPHSQPTAGPPPVGTVVPIVAPMVGVFYTQPDPSAEPFVAIGTLVDEETTVGMIEVMKLFSSIRAGVRGIITEVIASSGEFVEYGQPLFLVDLATDRPAVGQSPD